MLVTKPNEHHSLLNKLIIIKSQSHDFLLKLGTAAVIADAVSAAAAAAAAVIADAVTAAAATAVTAAAAATAVTAAA